jgi:hypothetical protein
MFHISMVEPPKQSNPTIIYDLFRTEHPIYDAYCSILLHPTLSLNYVIHEQS